MYRLRMSYYKSR